MAQRRRRASHRRALPWWAALVVVVAVLGVAELAARAIGPNIEREAGSEERVFIKSDQIFDRRGEGTDVAIIGSSHTAGGLVPSAIGDEVPELSGIYNAGLTGISMDGTIDWTERVVLPHLDPEIVVIGILPMTVLDGAPLEGEDILAEQEQANAAYEAAIDQVDPGQFGDLGWQLRNRSSLIRYRPYLRSPSTAWDALRATVAGDDPEPPATDDTDLDWLTETDPARFAANTGPDGEIYDYRSPSLPTDADPLGAALYQAFAKGTTDYSGLEDLVDAITDAGAQPVIAIAPVDRGPLEAGGADLAPLDAIAADLVAWGEDRGIPVDDQFTEDWDRSLFHDRNHLDAEGAQAWSTHLGRWLQEQCAAGALAPACEP